MLELGENIREGITRCQKAPALTVIGSAAKAKSARTVAQFGPSGRKALA